MNKNKHNQNDQEGQEYITVQHVHRPYWKRIHHTWSFWIFLSLMFIGIIYYIMTVDFSSVPDKQKVRTPEDIIAP